MNTRIKSLVVVAAALLPCASRVWGANIAVDFTGPAQSFAGGLSVSGDATLVMTGQIFNSKTNAVEPFVTVPPTSHALALYESPQSINKIPTGVSPPASFEMTTAGVNAISDLQLDLFGGSRSEFNFDDITAKTNSKVAVAKNIPLSLYGALESLNFSQTGGATTTPTGPGVGQFSVPGNFSSLITYDEFLFGLFPMFNEGSMLMAAPGSLTGTYTVSGPANNATLALDGTIELALPFPLTLDLPFATNLGGIQVTMTADASIAATFLINASFHLEQTGIIIPEPGSLALLWLGGASIALGYIGQRKHRRSNSQEGPHN